MVLAFTIRVICRGISLELRFSAVVMRLALAINIAPKVFRLKLKSGVANTRSLAHAICGPVRA